MMNIQDPELIIKDSILPELNELAYKDKTHSKEYKELQSIYKEACTQIKHNKIPYKLLHGPIYFLKIDNNYEAAVYKDIVMVSRIYSSIIRNNLLQMSTV